MAQSVRSLPQLSRGHVTGAAERCPENPAVGTLRESLTEGAVPCVAPPAGPGGPAEAARPWSRFWTGKRGPVLCSCGHGAHRSGHPTPCVLGTSCGKTHGQKPVLTPHSRAVLYGVSGVDRCSSCSCPTCSPSASALVLRLSPDEPADLHGVQPMGGPGRQQLGHSFPTFLSRAV